MHLPMRTLLALLPCVAAGASGTGTTTRYWDCCKPSCAWPGKAALQSGSNPVTTCDIANTPLADYNTASGCNGGGAYQCSNESPWAVDENLAYGYAAVNIAGGSESSWCCACYELTFTSGAVVGKKMIVQATNTGGDLAGNQFDISIPGGGVGIFNGCTQEWGAPSTGWGAQYGGIASRADCDGFPEALKAGCYWRFDWFAGADNPSVSFQQVACPAAITANSGCTRADDSSMAAPAAASGSAAVAPSSSSPAVVASSSSIGAVEVSSAQAVATPMETSAPAAASLESSSAVPTVLTRTMSAKKPSTKLTVAPGKPSATYHHHGAHHSHEEDDVCEF